MLYKYLGVDRFDVLENQQIRFTQPAVFNDPFENKPVINSIAPEDEARRQFNELLPDCLRDAYQALPPEFRSVLPYDQFLLYATQQMDREMPNALKLLDNMKPMVQDGLGDFTSKIGILSLSECPDELLMWAHYASSHAGFVIGFDNQHSYFDSRKGPGDELRHLRKVKYVDQRPNLPMVELTGDEMFLTKSSHWAYENEWRILRPLQEADRVIDAGPEAIYLFSFPPEIIRTVIFGHCISSDLRNKILAILRSNMDYSKVEILQTKIDSQEYKLDFELV